MKKKTKTPTRVGGSARLKKPRATASTARATARRRSVFPAHLASTPAEWRAIKLSEWLEVTQALDRYRYGSSFTPAQAQLYNLGRLSRQITEALLGEWVAW